MTPWGCPGLPWHDGADANNDDGDDDDADNNDNDGDE